MNTEDFLLRVEHFNKIKNDVIFSQEIEGDVLGDGSCGN